ncbi:MAG: hypothetical protein LBU83_13545, partial [Bacteroidales bacterium]|nr:hypothetical protein [Bacteroidales bacterium]
KTKETEERGKKQLKKYRSLTDNQSIPAYLIFLNDNEPYFEIINIDNDSKNDEEKQNIVILNFPGQCNARFNEKINRIKKNEKKIVDYFKYECLILTFLIFGIGFFSKKYCYQINITDLSLLIMIIALRIIPYASKLKFLGIEFERLIKENSDMP